jgi:putative membrane protein
MFGYGSGMHAFGWLFMLAGSVLFWICAAILVVLAIRALRPDRELPPEAIIARRYARGEISETQYRDLLATLRRL